MLSGWKKMLQDMSESVTNLASNAVADATITASLNLASLQSSNESDAWHALGVNHRLRLQAISDNQNKNHVACGQASSMLSSACSKLQSQHASAERLQQDLDFVCESKSSLTSLASDLGNLSRDLIALTNFLAVFREVHISRSASRMKEEADADLLRAQKTSHARITAATRARDLNLDKSINTARATVSRPPAKLSSATPPSTEAQFGDDTQPGPASQVHHVSDDAGSAPEAVLAPKSKGNSGDDAGECVVIDFEQLLSTDQDGSLPIDSSQAVEEIAAGE
jgi:hypothetical protein